MHHANESNATGIYTININKTAISKSVEYKTKIIDTEVFVSLKYSSK